MRPHQWVKNLFVLAPLVFAKGLTDEAMVSRALIGFFAFCMASSAVYVLNDLADIDTDRAHPIKRNRPIASGVVSKNAALLLVSLLAAICLGLGATLGIQFVSVLLGYFTLNIAYSFWLKRVPYIDVLCIATGFELRVIAGTFAATVSLTVYLLIVTFLLAAFLGFGKRLHEILQGTESHAQRTVLKGYSERLLNLLLVGAAVLTIATYSFYTIDPNTAEFFGTKALPCSIPFAVFGVFRFLQLVRGRPEAESPTEEMLRDIPFVANLMMWACATLAIIYS